MNTHLLAAPVLASLILAPFALAQGPAITTSTDYGAVADLGGTVDFDSAASGTTVGRGLGVRASEGSFFGGSDFAVAGTFVARARSFSRGSGVSIAERGRVRNGDPTQGASAGTSSDAPGTANPSQGAHGLSMNYANIAAGTNAIVSIRWFGNATAGASCTADVDVDGDGVPDFQGVADGNRSSAVLQVTAGAGGVTIDIETNGMAALAADGQEGYFGALSVFVIEGTLPTSCTFTNFGNACGADLNGSVSANLDIQLDVTNAAADRFGVLIAGDQLATPVPAPIGSCDLLVDRVGFFARWFRTDGAGAAALRYRTPIMAVTVSFQALVFGFDRSAMMRTLDTSNGTELVCQ